MASSLREIEEFSSPQDQFMTQQEAIDELINRQKAASAAGTVSPFQSSFNPFNPNFRATAQNAISNMLGGSQISSNPNYLQGRIANSLSGLVDFIPAVGDAVGVGDTITSYRQGDIPSTVINAAATGIGVLPLVGGPASKAVKAGGNRVRSALRGIDPSLPKYEGMRDATVQHLKNKGIMSQREFDRAERDSFEKTGNWDSMPEPEAVYTIDDSGSNSSYVTIKKPKNYAEEGMGDPDEYTIRFSDHSLPKQYAYDQNIYNVSDDYYDETINGKTLNDAIDYADRLVPSSSVALGETPSVRDGGRSALNKLPELNIDDLDEDQYIQAINPQGTRIKPEARPNLGMGDMYGMASRNAEEIMTQELRSGETIRYVQDGDSVYALGYNPDLGEEDVVGYMLGGGDGSELAVVDQMQGKGIGGNLSYLYRSQNPMAQSGGFTEAGEAAARQAYRRIMGYE